MVYPRVLLWIVASTGTARLQAVNDLPVRTNAHEWASGLRQLKGLRQIKRTRKDKEKDRESATFQALPRDRSSHSR